MKEKNINTTIKVCEKCGEPLEQLFPNGPILGRNRHPRMCSCMRIADAEERMDRARREQEEMISHNRSICFSDKAMYEWNFRNDDHTVSAMELARGYVQRFEIMLEENIGYLFWGGVGTGKTYIAACIANALLDKSYTVKMTNFATIINDLFSSTDKNGHINSLVNCDLLIIDDLGAERNTDYAIENVFNVIDRRYRTGKPMIITTNLQLSMLYSEPSLDKKRIYDRILENCVPVSVSGSSKRTAAGKEKMDQVRKYVNESQKGGTVDE